MKYCDYDQLGNLSKDLQQCGGTFKTEETFFDNKHQSQ